LAEDAGERVSAAGAVIGGRLWAASGAVVVGLAGNVDRGDAMGDQHGMSSIGSVRSIESGLFGSTEAKS
jgi:hypothetical protein